MNDDGTIISGFDSAAAKEAPFAVDFSIATQLNVSGSTCDVYECVVQRRRVFVKRLKAEYRNNPLYRAAFDKEFDLGVSLSHPSLPRYVGFGGDYIVMDFVEGETLAELIKRGDSRLKNSRFVGKLLSELIDVAEYLHNRNIVHCDIKPDNIIISPYPDRPATLIDFDKAYSPWLDSTHGDTAKYGCEECADGSIDFKGIGLIAARLGMKRVADACNRPDVSAESLRAVLDGRKKSFWWILAGCVVIVAGAVGLWPEVERVGKVEEVDSNHSTLQTEAIAATTTQPLTESQLKWIESLIVNKSAEINESGQELMRILDSDTVSIGDKRTAIMDYTYQYGVTTNQIIYSAVEKYRNLPELEVQIAVRNHPAWVRLMTDKEEVDKRINEWDAKESQRSSGLPVSQPDTIQDADHSAPHR